PEAITCLGTAYREGWYGLVKSEKKAAKIFKRAVELGEVDAMTNLGAAYYNGEGVKQDWKKAKRLHRMAADRGCATGQCNVGEICEVKEGDISEARKWYALSAAQELARLRRHVENEVPEAISFLGCAYRRGYFGLVKSDKKAAKIWKRAVELGDVEAMVQLGAAYYLGRGVKLDWKKAKRLHRMAADRGSAVGQKNNEVPEAIAFLGRAYRHGDFGLVKSDKKAAKIFKRAVELGDVDAMVSLGAAYYLGQGVKLDWKKAKRLHRMAANRGSAMAQCNVGEICEVKEGDISEARKWYALSAAQGFK
ncbi:hypothetical protein AURANDRAFT_2559, partial [Aureococcus anophagefferens]